VAAAAPFAFNEAMLSVGGRGLGILLKGIDPVAAAQVTATARHLCRNEGQALDVADPVCRFADDGGPALLEALLQDAGDGLPAIIVGLQLYRRLGVPLGTQVHLMTPVGMAGSRGGAPKRMPFVLAGVFASGMHEFDAHLVYAALPAAQRLLGLGSSVSGVELRLTQADDVAAVGEQLMTALGHYPYRSLDWRELNASIFMALSLQKVVMFLVLAFIVVVAAFNIASTLFMAVVEKGPQIAVLLSLGATRATIMKIFVLEGWLTGIAGTALGALMGLGATFALAHMKVSIAADVYMVDALTVSLAPQEVALTIGAALIICHLATLYPALRATRARPIDLLRHG
jgi:lipoprotein-releasing system permease protein